MFFFKFESNTEFKYFKTLPQSVKWGKIFHFILNWSDLQSAIVSLQSLATYYKKENVFLEDFVELNLYTTLILWGL